ncbi:hypothetical protein [Virgibacillus halodenitrificans]|uniref:hypothetical protein n=1 Tax=Virgibacillus halodenitrificans TaxID=1482 RepID=UPI000EF4EAD1|nr:hypothetical protein [Virgibacillus halodenitrificans]
MVRKKNLIVEDLERKAEIMEYVMLENQKKRIEENQVIFNIDQRKREFKNKWEPFYHTKLDLMTLEQIQGLNSQCLNAITHYLYSLSNHLVKKELPLGKRTLGYMIGDISIIMEHIVSSTMREEQQDGLLRLFQFLMVYEELQHSYLAVDFYSIKRKFPKEFFLLQKEEKENSIA